MPDVTGGRILWASSHPTVMLDPTMPRGQIDVLHPDGRRETVLTGLEEEPEVRTFPGPDSVASTFGAYGTIYPEAADTPPPGEIVVPGASSAPSWQLLDDGTPCEHTCPFGASFCMGNGCQYVAGAMRGPAYQEAEDDTRRVSEAVDIAIVVLVAAAVFALAWRVMA